MSLNITIVLNNATFSAFQDTLPEKIIKIMMYCILFVVSFTGNLLIIWVTSRDIRLRSTTNILIANMAVSDLLVPILAMPRHIVDIIFYTDIWLIDGGFGLALCKLIPYLQDVSLGVSIYSCVFIAVDRFYAVVHPLRGGLSKGKLKYIIPGIWMFSMAMFSIYFVIMIVSKRGHLTVCILDLTRIGAKTDVHRRIYYFTVISLNVWIPLPIISFLYLRIALKLRRTTIPWQAGNASSSVRERQNKNALIMSVVIISLFFLSFVPFTVVICLTYFGNLKSLSPRTIYNLFFSVIFVGESSCCYNFFTYLVFTKVYRENFKNLFSKCTCVNPCPGRARTNSFGPENMAPVELREIHLNAINDLT